MKLESFLDKMDLVVFLLSHWFCGEAGMATYKVYEFHSFISDFSIPDSPFPFQDGLPQCRSIRAPLPEAHGHTTAYSV